MARRGCTNVRRIDSSCDLWREGIQKEKRFSFGCKVYVVVGVVVLAQGERSREQGDAVSVGSVTISSLDNNCSMDLLTFYNDASPNITTRSNHL